MLRMLMLTIFQLYICTISEVVTGKSHYIPYYPGRKMHNNKVITTKNILLLVTTITLVCM